MCGRYFFQMDRQISEVLRKKIEQLDIEDFQQGEIFPSQKALVLTKGNEHEYEATIQSWGIKTSHGNRLINARKEGIQDKYTFQSILNNRCVIVANGFYEWKSVQGKKEKIAIKKHGQPVFYMAGIFNPQKEFVIVTGESQDEMATLHHRTPIIMNEEQMMAYLHHTYDYVVNNKDLLFHKV